jgi:phosphonate transport system substrate-binding protein
LRTAVIAALLAVGIGLGFMLGGASSTPDNRIMMAVTGLGRPVANRLSPQYADNNQDLVADPPADAAALLDPPTLRFSFIATPDPAHYQSVFAGLVRHLGDATGRPAEYVPYASVQRQLQDLRDGNLHVVGFSTGSVPIAVNAAGYVPLCTPGGQGASRYSMLLIVPATSALQAPGDLKGRTLTLTAPNSNSGYKAPLVILLSDFGMEPGRDFEIVNSFDHLESIRRIATGEAAAAAVASDLLERAEAQGVIQPDQYRTIYRSEQVPTAAIGHSHALGPELAATIRDALLEYDWEGTALATEYAATGADRFEPVSYKDDWAIIRRIDDAVGYRHELPPTEE